MPNAPRRLAHAARAARATHGALAGAVAASLAILFTSGNAAAANKDECLEAHGRGQDLRDKGQVTRARQAFLTCASPACPNLVQGDCARMAEEIDRLVPSVSFGARDGRNGDLPNTSVYVDDTLVATRLDDGKSYDLDPGRHVVRFVHDGKESTMKVVLNQGEKGRTLVATFADPAATPRDASEPPAAPPAPKRSAFPLVVAGVGAAALAAGGALLVIGLHNVPANCSIGSHECAAPPGDKAFDDANKGVSMANLGIGVGLGGAAVLAGGIVWYFVQPVTPAAQAAKLVQPWVGRGSGGVSLGGSF